MQGEGDEKGAVRRGEAGKQLRFSESRTTERPLMNPLYLCSSQALWVSTQGFKPRYFQEKHIIMCGFSLKITQ